MKRRMRNMSSKEVIWMEVTRDEFELPIRIADSVEELAEMCGKSVNCIRSDISHWKAGRLKTCRFRKVEIEEDNFAPAQKKEKGEVKDGKDHRNSKGNNGSIRRKI